MPPIFFLCCCQKYYTPNVNIAAGSFTHIEKRVEIELRIDLSKT
jgi:hypothetical protein